MEKSDIKSALMPVIAMIILTIGAIFMNSVQLKTNNTAETSLQPVPVAEKPSVTSSEATKSTSPDTLTSTPVPLPNFSVNSSGGEDEHGGLLNKTNNDD